MRRRTPFLKSAAFRCVLSFCLAPVLAVIGITGLQSGQAYFPQKYQVHGLHVAQSDNPLLYWLIETIWLIATVAALASGCRSFWLAMRAEKSAPR